MKMGWHNLKYRVFCTPGMVKKSCQRILVWTVMKTCQRVLVWDGNEVMKTYPQMPAFEASIVAFIPCRRRMLPLCVRFTS